MANQPKDSNRRDFLRAGGKGLLLAVPLSLAFNKLTLRSALAQGAAAKDAGKPAAGGAGAKGSACTDMMKTTDPQAQALGYVEDAAKVDTKKWPKRAGPEGAKQFCWNCQFYVTKGDPKAEKTAPCQIFANKCVTANGWCNTWTQNPKVKA